MKKNTLCTLVAGMFLAAPVFAQTTVEVKVNAGEGKKLVSPYIYGKNGCVENSSYSGSLLPKEEKEIGLCREAGLRFARLNEGNNSTKYNWKARLGSHPDWYNNVYSHDWTEAVNRLNDHMPDVQAMFGFQLSGYVAKTTAYNFNDYSYNNSSWWEGVNQNLAGGGEPNETGTKAKVEGDYSLYLTEWPADSTVALLDYWQKEKGFDMSKLQYWSMDNEPEIWSGTHDDLPLKFTAEEFIEKYIEVAKKARALYPDIKLCGPVTANEWQWFKFNDEVLTIDGRYYCWLEYFIKRIADEQKASGIRLLDVFDLHWYPQDKSFKSQIGLHRVFFDEDYLYTSANGLATINGGWDVSYHEMIFARVNKWLDEHFGEGHGITLGLTETAFPSDDPNMVSLMYAGFLGTFMENGVELFSPWTWKVGMWETLHLFSRYSKEYNVSAASSDIKTLSAYTTVNAANDSMTIIFVNRSENDPTEVQLDIENFNVGNGVFKKYELSDLPKSETFVSHENNALKVGYAKVEGNKTSLTLPAKSITALVLSSEATGLQDEAQVTATIEPYPNPTTGSVYMANYDGTVTSVEVYDAVGQCVYRLNGCEAMADIRIDLSSCSTGVYYAKVYTKFGCVAKQIILKK